MSLLRLNRPRGWAAAFLVVLAGCVGSDGAREPGADTIRVRDDAGRLITLATPARRIISLIPAQTEIVKLLAGRDVLIARTVWRRLQE